MQNPNTPYLSSTMYVHRSLDFLPPFRHAVITIGTFDGVHLGHQKIIDALLAEADKVYGESVVITFDPHPRKILQPKESLQLINSLEERIELLQKAGIQHIVVVPFTREFSEQSADAYIENFLVSKFHPHTIIIGYDHRFGKNRSGDFRMLDEKKIQYGYHLSEVPRHVLDEIAVSSTKIRNALLSSDVEKANKLLGYDFFFEGRVVAGDKIGRSLGYPTANLVYTDADKIHLGAGVYAVYAAVEGKEYKGMLSIGNRPTLNDTTERVEVNIFDFDEDLYEKIIRVAVKKFIRSQEKYSSLQDLKARIALDKDESLKVL